jgi:starch phosphorylase
VNVTSVFPNADARERLLVAYLCLEFGIDETLPIYAGGLGVLAGDHLKSAADLGVPVVGAGLLYRRGYFRQSLDPERGQSESYPAVDPDMLPISLVRGADGNPVEVGVDLGPERVLLRVWRAELGAVSLFLLDSDAGENSDEARELTAVLYPADPEIRVRQEVLLGVGAVRMFAALGIEPTVFHMNEGHTAFAAFERIRRLVAAGRSWHDALDHVRSTTVFTTHTPVPAGNETHDPALVRTLVSPLADDHVFAVDDLIELGRDHDTGARFGMTELALRTSGQANAVSAAHGDVARTMWAGLWPVAGGAVPADHVTNGVHAPTWVAPELATLLRDAGVALEARPGEQGWPNAAALDAGELWNAHRARKAALLAFTRDRTGAAELDDDALTIGFARRFATYKRAYLLASDGARLLRLLSDTSRPVQVIFAGKAHPADRDGKEVLRRVLELARGAGFAGRVAVLDDYGLDQARLLVQGVDLWLNTPRRALEASGTSGMKAAMNGVLNLSVLDGWWREGFDPAFGWAVGDAYSDAGDDAEAGELLRLLEQEIVPAFFDRDDAGLPQRWLEAMRASIAAVGERFNSGRMLAEYAGLYARAHTGSLGRERAVAPARVA